MIINYIASFDGNPKSGVTQKILGQVRAMKDNGISVILHLIGKKDTELAKEDFIRFYESKRLNGKVFRKIEVNNDSKRIYKFIINKAKPEEIIYIRNFIPMMWFYILIKTSKNKIFVELASNAKEEARLRKSYTLLLFLKIYGSKILNNCSGVISVTPDIIELYKLKNVPKLIIGNGIKDIQKHSAPKPLNTEENKVVNLISVANINKWTGLDRLLKGIKLYNGNLEFHIHVVGEGPELAALKVLTATLGIKNVIFYGLLDGKELLNVYNIAHIGVGNLGTYRKGLVFTSALKLREYCALGIPFIYSGIDLDFQETEFSLSIIGNDYPVDLYEVEEFYIRLKTIDDLRDKIKAFTSENILWTHKMKVLKKFIENTKS